MNKVDISVIIPLYNRVDLIAPTIRSVQAQTYSHWEALIIDDGSTDGSIELVENYAREDNRIKILSRDRHPKGAPACRNIGLDYAKGEYIVFLDSDDLLAPFCLERRLAQMRVNVEADFMIYPMLLFKEQPGDLDILWNINNNEDDLARFLRMDALWQTTCPIYKRTSLVQIGGFDEELPFLQDYELHVRTLCVGFNYIKKMDVEPDCFLRRHKGENISQKGFNSKESFSTKEIIYKKILGNLLDNNRREYLLYGSALFFSLSKDWLLKFNDFTRSLACWQNVSGIIEEDLYKKGIDYLQTLNTYNKNQSISFFTELNSKETGLPLIYSYQKKSLNIVSQTVARQFENGSFPLFSVLIPFSNSSSVFQYKIQSVLHQVFPFLEVIIIDNTTSDASRAVLDNYIKQDKRIQVIHELPEGMGYDYWNKAVQIAKGEYIWIAETEYQVDEQFLRVIADYLKIYPNSGMIYFTEDKNYTIDNVSRKCPYQDEKQLAVSFYRNGARIIKNLLIENNKIPMPSEVLVRKSTYERVMDAHKNLKNKWLFWSCLLLYGDILFISDKGGYVSAPARNEAQRLSDKGINFEEISEILLQISEISFVLKMKIKNRALSAYIDLWLDLNLLSRISFQANVLIFRNLIKVSPVTYKALLQRLLVKILKSLMPVRKFQ